MNYLLDSDVVNILYDDRRKTHHETILRRIAHLREGDSLHTSVLVLCELEYSWWNAPDDKKISIRNTINALWEDFDAVLPLDAAIAPIFGELKAFLKTARLLDREAMRRHNIDLLLASTAIHTGAVLIGTDRLYQELARTFPALHVEDWLKE